MADFSLSSLQIKTASVQGSREFFEGNASPRDILAQVVEVLNDPDESRKERVRALVVLSNLARVEAERDTLLDAVRYLGEPFEQALIERETGAEQFSKHTKCDEMHELVVLLFVRIMDYRFSTADLLDLLRNKHQLALATIESTLKKSAYEDEVAFGLTRLLHGMTTPQTYFSTTKNSHGMLSERDCSEFNVRISDLVDKFRSSDILKTWRDAVLSRVSKAGPQQVHFEMLASGLEFLQNTYMFANEGATGFRQHCLVASGIPDVLLVPVMSAIIDKFNDVLSSPVGPTALHAIKLVLKTFVLMTFEMFSYTRTLRTANFTVPFLSSPSLVASVHEHPAVFALLLLFNTNIDSMSPPGVGDTDAEQAKMDGIATALDIAWRGYSAAKKEQVVRLFTTVGSLPVSRQTHTYGVFLDMLGYQGAGAVVEEGSKENELSSDNEAVRQEGVEDGKASKSYRLLGTLPNFARQTVASTRWQVRKPRKEKKRKKNTREREEQDAAAGASQTHEGEKEGAASLDEDVAEYPTASAVVLGIPDEFVCSLNGNVMKEPMRSKQTGLCFEKKSLEAWFEKKGHVCPATGQPLAPKDVVFDQALALQITNFHIQQSCQVNAGAFDTEEDLYSF